MTHSKFNKYNQLLPETSFHLHSFSHLYYRLKEKNLRPLLKACSNKNHFTAQNISDLDSDMQDLCVEAPQKYSLLLIQHYGHVLLVTSTTCTPSHFLFCCRSELSVAILQQKEME